MLPPEKIEAGIIDGHLHVGIIPKHKTLTGLSYQDLYQETSLLYCAKGHQLFEQDENCLKQLKLTETDAVTHLKLSSDEMGIAQANLLNSASSNGREGIAFLILSGSYIGYLPTHYAKQWEDTNLLKTIQPSKYFYHTDVVTAKRKGARENVVLNEFMACLKMSTN